VPQVEQDVTEFGCSLVKLTLPASVRHAGATLSAAVAIRAPPIQAQADNPCNLIAGRVVCDVGDQLWPDLSGHLLDSCRSLMDLAHPQVRPVGASVIEQHLHILTPARI
jgi:hypothetical protein